MPLWHAFAHHWRDRKRCETLQSMKHDSPTRSSPRRYSRRQFGQTAAAGLLLFFSMNRNAALAQGVPTTLPPDLQNNKRLDSWLRINPEGTVDVFTGKVELGQGNTTALAQITADELDVAFGRIRMLPADTAHSPNESYTAGSASIEASGGALRYVAADARATLLAMAAAKLGVETDGLAVEDGVISGSGGRGRITYWELAAANLLAREVRSDIPLKPNS